MPTYTTVVKLGEKYRDTRTSITGHATSVYFHPHGCVEVRLEFLNADGKLEGETFPEQRLEPLDESMVGQTFTHTSDIVHNRKYRDVETGLTGYAAVVAFYEHMTDRVEIKSKTTNSDGTDKLTYYTIDSFLLEDVETQQVARKQDKKPSPATREGSGRRL